MKDYRHEETPFWAAPWFKFSSLAVLGAAAACAVGFALLK